MDNAFLTLRGIEVEVLIDNGGGIDGYRMDGNPIDMRVDSPSSRLILEYMVELQEEAASVVQEWEREHVMSRAYYDRGY